MIDSSILMDLADQTAADLFGGMTTVPAAIPRTTRSLSITSVQQFLSQVNTVAGIFYGPTNVSVTNFGITQSTINF
jgi:hypothetical protein